MKKTVNHKLASQNKILIKLRWLYIAIVIFIVGSLFLTIKSGTGPFSFFASPSSINETKTVCTRRTDGKKVCTEYTPAKDVKTVNGVKTQTSTTKVIDSGANGGSTLYEYKAEKKTNVATGISATVETRNTVDKTTQEKKELSKIVTVQDQAGKVISDVRTGDFTVGVTVDKSPDAPSQVAADAPRGSQCGTRGSPVNSGTWVATGRGWENGASSRNAGTTQRECVQCGGDGNYTGSKACNELVGTGESVVLPYDGGKPYTGVEGSTGSCFTKGDSGWVQVGFGSQNDSGRRCGMSGEWVDDESFNKDLTAICSAKGLQVSDGKCAASSAAVSPTTTTPAPPRSDASRKPATCTTGMAKLAGRDVYIECSANGYPGYTFCSGGTFVDNKCVPNAITTGDANNDTGFSISNQGFDVKLGGAGIGVDTGKVEAGSYLNSNEAKVGAGTLAGAALGGTGCAVTGILTPLSPVCALVGGAIGWATAQNVTKDTIPTENNTGFAVSNQGFDVKLGGAGVGVDTGEVGISAYLSSDETKVGAGTLAGAALGGTGCAVTGILTPLSPVCAIVGGAIGWFTSQQIIDN